MVYKPSIGSVDVEEEDVYLRKCNIRKSKRQQEKSRRISQQANEQFSLDRTPSPVPPPAIKNGGSGSKGKFRSTFVPEPETESTHSTDDVYPAPSPPPRSPSFTSPVALTRTLALSLSLFSPAGYTISGGKKSISRQSSSAEVNGLSYANPIGRSRSDSNGSWGEFVLPGSPQRSPNAEFHKSRDSAGNNGEKSPPGADSPIDVNAYREQPDDGGSYSKDSSRVKQFLFHRDRDRARKAQLLYPSAGGSLGDITQEWDEYEYGGAENKTPGKRGSPTEGANRKSLSKKGSGGRSQHQQHWQGHSRSAGKSPAERYIAVDLETDIRAGTNGAVFGPRSAERKAHHVQHSPPLTPFVVIPTPPKDSANSLEDPFGHNSPYYRALTLGFTSPAVDKAAVLEKNGYGSSSGASPRAKKASFSDSERSDCADPASPHSAAKSLKSAQPRKDSTGSEHSEQSWRSERSANSVHSVDPTAEAYDTLFPALPVPAAKASPPLLVGGLSALSLSLAKPAVAEVEVSSHQEESPAELSAVTTEEECSTVPSPENSNSLPTAAPVVPLYSAYEVGTMLHQALLSAATLLNYPDGAPLPAVTPSKGAVRAMRAWDDADSSDSDEDCSQSDASSRDDSVASSVSSLLHEHVQKLSEIDATCGSLMQKCDYIYDILKCRYPQRFDADFVRLVSAPHVQPSTVARSQECPPLCEVLSHYVRPHMVYSFVQSLQYEDTRFESARTPILHVLYKSATTTTTSTAASTASCMADCSASMRVKIAHAIESAVQERYERCVRLLTTASQHEMDLNYLSKEGYADLVGAPNLSAIDTIAANCDQNAVIDSENERANYKTKDSEITIIELVKFIVAHEINESLCRLQEQVESPWSPSKTPPNKTSAATSVAQYQQSTAVLAALTRAYCSLFRCYTHKLGAHYAGSSESVEQPVLLEHLMQLLDGLLAWSKILTNLRLTHSSGDHHPNQHQHHNHELGNQHHHGSPDGAATAPDTPLDVVCSTILSSACKHWTAGLNYGQDIAYLLQSEVVLAIYAPSPALSSTHGASSSVTYSSAFRAADKVLPPLLRKKDAVHTVLLKMLSKVTSQHTKVATQALQSVQNPVLMVRYFLPRVTTAMVSYIFGTEVGRITFLAGLGWDNQRREDCLNGLVDRLRECREIHQLHSPQLQASSAQLLDTTLELLQVIEDAE